MPNLSQQNLDTLDAVSGRLGVDPEWMYKLIKFESNWDPQAKNPNSSARGLIQIINSSARGIGYKDSADAVIKNPSIDQQLENIVYPYLEQYRPFSDQQSLYMAVFYPRARTWAIDQEFPERVQKVNPGIKTVRDYMRKIDPDIPKALPILAVLLAGVGLWIYQRSK